MAQAPLKAPLRMPDAFSISAISIDVSDPERMGAGCGELFVNARHTAQIDHHGTNPAYAAVNIIRSPLSATGVLIAGLLDALGVPFDRQIAECLYVAVATDTGNFKQANADADAFAVAARCAACGFDIAAVSRRVFDVRPVCQVQTVRRGAFFAEAVA